MSDASTAAVAQLIQGLDPGAMVTKFVVVAEVINPDGERVVWIDSGDATAWDVLGLLTFALNPESDEDDEP